MERLNIDNATMQEVFRFVTGKNIDINEVILEYRLGNCTTEIHNAMEKQRIKPNSDGEYWLTFYQLKDVAKQLYSDRGKKIIKLGR